MTLRGLEGALHGVDHYEAAYFASYPLVAAFHGLSTATLQNLVYLVAMIKLGMTLIWAIIVGLNTNMGVAWHRFLAFPNIWFKRDADGPTALGALQPMTSRRQGRSTSRTRARTTRGPLRRLPGRALLLEGPAGLLHLHRVRPLPVAVPGLEHRQAALPEAADHVAARPRARQGPLPAGRRRQDHGGRGEGDAGAAGRRPRRRAGRGRAPADRHRRGERRHRPRRAVVLHHLRRLRRAVPGRHRARRPHRRHAPLPGDDRVRVPERGRARC